MSITGTWYEHPEANNSWTNYTSCIDMDDLNFRNVVNNLYVVGYSISIFALMFSLAMYLMFRSLQCARIRIHMHLFSAFILSNAVWIFWYKAVVNNVEVVQNNKVWCQVVHVVNYYFMICSYFWMFCEGLHLHLALVWVFVREQETMPWFIVIGWISSLLVVLVYAITRYFAGATERCWMDHSDTIWIIILPVLLSLIVSFGFLIKVLCVLLTKLHPTPNAQRSSNTAKKAVRAAMLLIPLFGLNFILIPLRPERNSFLEKPYQIVSALITSLQGLIVSVLFCFTNQDVVTAVRTHVARRFARNDNLPMTGLTAAESIMNTRDNVV